MEDKNIITLDLTDCRYLGELHERIKIAFEFPEWYGKNWSAFWDLLRSECNADEVIITGVKTLSKEFEAHMCKMYEILERNKIEHERDMSLYDDIKPFSYRIVG